MNLHSVPRMPYDVDILVRPDREAYERAHRALVGLGLRPCAGPEPPSLADAGTRDRLKKERNRLAVTHEHPTDLLRQVDVLIDPSIDAAGLVERAELRPFGRETLALCTRADLIAPKRAAGRVTDQSDTAALKRGQP